MRMRVGTSGTLSAEPANQGSLMLMMDNASNEDPVGEPHGAHNTDSRIVPLCTVHWPQEGAPEEEEILNKTDQRKFKKK